MKIVSTLVLILALSTAAYAEQTTRVIQIMSRPAASLIDAVRPVLGESGGVSAFHDKLILRGSPAEIAAAQAIVAELDRPARRLLIEVKQASHIDHSTQRFDYGLRTDNVRLHPARRRGRHRSRGCR